MKEINVLSLFDGISCGQVALERANIKVKNYFASEIDKHAIKITQKNYPKTIHVGCVTKLKSKDLPKIDLIIGGSPCQGFSIIGKKLNFDDERSKLFFEFVRLINECDPKYFLLENVPMKKEYANVISSILKVKPITIDSSLVSAQRRKRLYWTNIPKITILKDKGLLLDSVLENDNLIDYKPNKTMSRDKMLNTKELHINKNTKSFCLTTKQDRIPNSGIILFDGYFRFLTPIECERLQTLPDNYTYGITKPQRYKTLGNCWTVDVIVHILNHINNKIKGLPINGIFS